MSCCIERAIIEQIKALECSPIRPENHFIDQRECENCVPYLVVKASETQGLRTSSGLQVLWLIDIKAYFDSSKKAMARTYKDSVRQWLYQSGCLSLGECGCFCVTGVPTISSRPSNKEIVLSFSFKGSYQVSPESVSASA